MKRCLILTGGKLDLAFARLFLEKEEFDKVIAVDGGLEAAKALGLIPDYIVGDFDTLDPGTAKEFRHFPYIIWEVHKPEKNETDTELAVSRAVAIGSDEVIMLGATGGRLDHMLGNLHLLYACMQKGVFACMVDKQNKVYMLDQDCRFERQKTWGDYISFLPFSEKVEGITLKGFRYPLEEKSVMQGQEVGLCISNELIEETGSISFRDGVLVCVESCD